MRLVLLLVVAISCCGCGTRFMTKEKHPLSAPPAGKALVVFHRPSSFEWGDDCTIYDGTRLIGNLRGNEWCQYACSPGHHYFIGRAQSVSVTDSTLAAGKTYDFVLDVGIGAWHANVVLQPMPKDDSRRKRLQRWERDDDPLRLKDEKDTAAQSEKASRANERAITDFTTGPKQDRLMWLRADDCR